MLVGSWSVWFAEDVGPSFDFKNVSVSTGIKVLLQKSALMVDPGDQN